MEFYPYPKIGHYLEDIDNIKSKKFIATEKVHGCNFSIFYDGIDIKVGRRKAFIKDGEKFYNYEKVISEYENSIKDIFEELCEKHKIDFIVIYGELFGGYYPSNKNNDNIGKKKPKPVQQGVYYSNKVDFIVFDIYLDGKEQLTYEQLETITKNRLKLVPIIKEGSLKELVKSDWEVNTIISKICNQEDLKDNIIEGVVIREKNSNGIMFKIKTSKFSEVRNKSNRKTIFDYITQNRFDNVRSKYSEDVNKDELLQEFINDIKTDYEIDSKSKAKITEEIKNSIISRFNFFYLLI